MASTIDSTLGGDLTTEGSSVDKANLKAALDAAIADIEGLQDGDAGTEALPSLSYSGDLDTGGYWPAANQFGISTAAKLTALFSGGGDNYLSFAGGATPVVSVAGADANVTLDFNAKGTGAIRLDAATSVIRTQAGATMAIIGAQSGGTNLFNIFDATAPTSNPSGGGYLYVESGALKYRGSSGTITTIANA